MVKNCPTASYNFQNVFLLVLTFYPMKLNMKSQKTHFGLWYPTDCRPNHFEGSWKRIILALNFIGSIVKLKISMTMSGQGDLILIFLKSSFYNSSENRMAECVEIAN